MTDKPALAAGIAPPRTVEAVLDAGRRLQRPAEDRWGIAWCAARGQALGRSHRHEHAVHGRLEHALAEVRNPLEELLVIAEDLVGHGQEHALGGSQLAMHVG